MIKRKRKTIVDIMIGGAVIASTSVIPPAQPILTSAISPEIDPILMEEIQKQGLNQEDVEIYLDYGKEGGKSPFSRTYKHKTNGKYFMIVSGLPAVDHEGLPIMVGWQKKGLFGGLIDKGFISGNNLFEAEVDNTMISLAIRNDQPDGKKTGDRLVFEPQLFLNNIEQFPFSDEPTLLAIDPTNENYQNNVLEWNYGIAKRRLRIIEGSMLGSWVFSSNPDGEVRIKYNQSGDFRLKLGQFATDNDTELIPTSAFITDEFEQHRQYPFIISDSATFYPDADTEVSSVDGPTEAYANNQTWAAIKARAGDYAYPSTISDVVIRYVSGSSSGWLDLMRAIYLFNTAALDDDAVIDSAVFSVYGSNKIDELGAAPTVNVVSSNPASNTNLVAADHSTYGTTLFSTNITYAGWNTTGYNDFTLNAAGLAAISKTGVTKLAVRENTYDIPNVQPPRPGNDKTTFLVGHYAEKGNGFKPKLVVTYTTTCTCPATPGNWTVNSSNNCHLETVCNIAGYGLILMDTGPGSFNLDLGADLTVGYIQTTSSDWNLSDQAELNFRQ